LSSHEIQTLYLFRVNGCAWRCAIYTHVPIEQVNKDVVYTTVFGT
jgi:hypothetical protein